MGARWILLHVEYYHRSLSVWLAEHDANVNDQSCQLKFEFRIIDAEKAVE